MSPARVEGIEFFDTPTGEDVQCARCGSSVYSVDCWKCSGEGTDGHECGEDCCACVDPEDNVRCDNCNGVGGWWRCMSGLEWCEANPLPGREHVTSTATPSTERDDNES